MPAASGRLAGSALRVASGYSDRSEAVIVYDEADKRVIHLLAIVPSLFWQELHERRQLGGDAEAAMWLRDLPGRSTTLRHCRGLWLEQEHPALAAGLCGMSCLMPGCCRPSRCFPTTCA